MYFKSFHEACHSMCYVIWIVAIGSSAATAFFWPFMEPSINAIALVLSILSILMAIWGTCKPKTK